MKPKRLLETDYLKSLMKRADTAFQSVRLFRRPAGGTLKLASGDWVRTGIPGQADLYAIRDGGAHFEIEIKRGGKLSPNQERWREWCVNRGIPWALLDVEEGELPAKTVERWVKELARFFGLGGER